MKPSHPLMLATVLLACSALLVGAPVGAQPAGPPGGVAPDWTLTVGVAPVVSPVFQGSDQYGLSVFPDLRVNYRDVFFASVPDGIGYNLVNTARWKLGPLAKLRFGRQEDTGGSPFLITGTTDGLRGLGEVDLATELGGFAQYDGGAWRLRAELRRGYGGHTGVVGDLSLSLLGRVGRVSYSVGPRLAWGTDAFLQPYFGIDARQAAASGLALHQARGGLVSFGLGAAAVRPLGTRAAVTLFAGLDRLGGPLRDSPLIRQRGAPLQFSAGLGYGYRFGWSR